MRQKAKLAMKADNPRLRMVRIDIVGDARNYTTGQQRVTVVPLTIRRKQNRKVMIPPTGDDSVLGAGGHDLPMIRMLGKAFYWQSFPTWYESERGCEFPRRDESERG